MSKDSNTENYAAYLQDLQNGTITPGMKWVAYRDGKFIDSSDAERELLKIEKVTVYKVGGRRYSKD